MEIKKEKPAVGAAGLSNLNYFHPVANLAQTKGHHPIWEILPLVESNKIRVMELYREGLSNKDIADELGIDRSTVYRILNKAEAEGVIRPLRARRKR